MKQFSGGWLSLQNSNPQPIAPYLSFVKCTFAGPVNNAQIQYSNVFNNPTGGAWVDSPIVIHEEPTVNAINGSHNATDLLQSQAMNAQTLMANYGTSVPPQLRGLVYLYNNPTQSKWMSQIKFNLGASNYNKLQIGIMESSVTRGDVHGNVQVYDFGTGPFTGVGTFDFLFGEYVGPLNIGIRLESTTNQSSIFELRCFLLQA